MVINRYRTESHDEVPFSLARSNSVLTVETVGCKLSLLVSPEVND